jgi:hypothetical protein
MNVIVIEQSIIGARGVPGPANRINDANDAAPGRRVADL